MCCIDIWGKVGRPQMASPQVLLPSLLLQKDPLVKNPLTKWTRCSSCLSLNYSTSYNLLWELGAPLLLDTKKSLSPITLAVHSSQTHLPRGHSWLAAYSSSRLYMQLINCSPSHLSSDGGHAFDIC